MSMYDELGEKAWKDILEKVRFLVEQKGKKPAEISRMLGHAGRSAVSNWLNGNSTAKGTSFSELIKYMDILGLDPHDYLPPAKPTIRRPGPNAPVEKVEGENLPAIPVYAIAGAGPGHLPDELEPLFKIAAPPECLRHSDYALLVDGHSMEPVIPHNSVVGIRADAPFRANELYLASIPYEGLVIKRIGVDRKTSEFIFKSENPNKEAYPDFRISIEESEKIILGRVVWIMVGY